MLKIKVNDIVKTNIGTLATVVSDLEAGMFLIRSEAGEVQAWDGYMLTVVHSAVSMTKHYSLHEWIGLTTLQRMAVMSITVDSKTEQFSDEFAYYVMKKINQACFTAFVRESYSRLKTHKVFGSKAIFEALRWDRHRIGDAGEEYKINNKFTADVARLAMVIFAPDLDGFFVTRHRKVA